MPSWIARWRSIASGPSKRRPSASRTRHGGAAAMLGARGRAVAEGLTRWRIGGSLLVSLVGYGRRRWAPRRRGLGGPRGVVGAVVAGAAGGGGRPGGGGGGGRPRPRGGGGVGG